MTPRSRLSVWLVAGFTAFGATVDLPASTAIRLIVDNQTLSSLQISMIDGSGRETRLGQAPPEFSNTLLIREPPSAGTIHLVARLPGEDAVLYRSPPIRVDSDQPLRWKLPENAIGHSAAAARPAIAGVVRAGPLD